MPKYKVTIEECAVYHIEVEAEDEDGAAAAAEEAFVQSSDRDQLYFSHVNERECVDIEEIN